MNCVAANNNGRIQVDTGNPFSDRVRCSIIQYPEPKVAFKVALKKKNFSHSHHALHANLVVNCRQASNHLPLRKVFPFKAAYLPSDNTEHTNVFLSFLLKKNIQEDHSSSTCNITLIAGDCGHYRRTAPK